jgi:hypothetical protein
MQLKAAFLGVDVLYVPEGYRCIVRIWSSQGSDLIFYQLSYHSILYSLATDSFLTF